LERETNMSREPTVIYSAANTQQAYLLKSVLEERGIPARVVNDAIGIAGGELPLGWTAAPRVVVAESDAEQGRRIAEEFDLQTAHEPTGDDPSLETATEEWSDWPVCPRCGERRSAACPVCGISQTSFRLADVQESAGAERALLVCEACDDHFVPQWYRLCHQCGYDYGEGLELDSPRQAVSGARQWIVLAALIGGALLFGIYFAWLFRAGGS
jgi:hypothetical protein